MPQVQTPRNPGMPLDLDWVAGATANTSAIERRAATLPGRRSIKKEFQAAWLLKAITLIDLTTLSGDDTPARVRRLCAKARQPVRAEILKALGMGPVTTGAVCVYHDMVERRSTRSGVRTFRSRRSQQDFRRAFPPCICALPRSRKASRPVPLRLISSSRADMC